MHVKFKVNLGSRDAESQGLKFTECTKDSELSVGEEVGRWLVSNGHAAEVAKPLRGVSAPPAIGEESKSTIKAEPATAKAKQASHKD